MKQQFLIYYLKFCIPLVVILSSVTACQKDDDTFNSKQNGTNSQTYKVTTISRADIHNNNKVSTTLAYIKAKKHTLANPDLAGKLVAYEQFNVVVDDSEAKYLETADGSYHSYTFKAVDYDNPTQKKNLVLSLKDDGTYKQILITYYLTAQDLVSYEQTGYIDFDTTVTTHSVEDDSFSVDIYSKELMPFQDSNCAQMDFGTMCSGSEEHTWAERMECPIFLGEIGGNPPTEPVLSIDENCLEGGTGGPLDDEGGNPPDHGDTGGGADEGTDDPDVDPSDPNNHGNGSNPVFAPDLEEVELVGMEENPCEALKELSDIPEVKSRLNSLKTNQGSEKGMRIDKNNLTGAYEPSPILTADSGEKHIRIPVNPNTMVVVHTHHTSVFEMFAGPDIIKMAEIASQVQSNSTSTVEFLSITHMLVVDGRTFALRFDDMNAVNILYNIASDQMERNNFVQKLANDYKSDKSGPPSYQLDTSVDKQQAHLYNLFTKYNISMTLYEADYDTNGFVSDWQRINKADREKEPCN